jgi:hypothetical protein
MSSAEFAPDDGHAPSDDRESLGVESIWRAMAPSREAEVEDPLLGRDLEGVVLLRVIGEGGMGRIYEARQHNPARPVAVKVMRPGLFSPTSLKRFLREAQILARLRHPAVAEIFAAGSFQVAGTRVPYFVMELIPEARPITRFAEERGLSIAARVALFRQVCEAVGHGHREGIIHRDIKPGNVLVDPFGHPKVIDFGVARWGEADDSMSAITATDQIIGSVAYMSPEQFACDPAAIGIRSDIHALGIMLYELLTGRTPYDLARKPIAEAARIVQEHEPVPADYVERRVPARLADVAARCLAKKPEHRFPDVAALLEALEQAGSKPTGRWWPRLARGRSRSGPRPAGGVSRRHGLATGLAATAVVATLAFSGRLGLTGAVPQPWRYGFRTVLQADADRWLVEAKGMRKWEEPFMQPAVSYWGPAENGVEGHLVYRFDLPAASRAIHLRLVLSCFADIEDVNVLGRGAAALEVSGDGSRWVSLCDNLSPTRWGADCFFDADLPEQVLGTTSLWLRMRFLMEGAPAPDGYAVAQFGRSTGAATADVFEIAAICTPATPGRAAGRE